MTSSKFFLFLHEYDLVDEQINNYLIQLKFGFPEFLCKSLYSAIYSLEQRYKKQRDLFEKVEQQALDAIFDQERDVLVRGCVLPIRSICTHIVVDRNHENEPETLNAHSPQRQAILLHTSTSGGDLMQEDVVEIPVTYVATDHDGFVFWKHSDVFIEVQRIFRKELAPFHMFEREPASSIQYAEN